MRGFEVQSEKSFLDVLKAGNDMGHMTLFQGPSFKYLLITKLIDLIIFEKLYYTFWQKNLFRDMWISCFMRLSFAYMAISETCRHDFYTFYIGIDIRALLM